MFPHTPIVKNGTITCIGCANAGIRIEGPAKGGLAPGLYYAHCHSCGKHYRFPKDFVLLGQASVTVASINELGANAAIGSADNNTKVIKMCSQINCSKAANLACSRSRCRLCCVIEGGCTAAQKHTLSSLSDNQHRKVPLQPPPSQYHSLPPQPLVLLPDTRPLNDQAVFPDPIDLLAEQYNNENPTIQLQRECLCQRHQECQALLEEERLEQEEEDEHQALLAATRAFLCALDKSPPLSPIPSTPQPTTVTISGLPVTRATTSNHPKITTQMNSTRMRDFEDRTKAPLALTMGGKNKIDKEMVHRFRIIWWPESGLQPSIFIVQECPKWPKWKLTDSVQALNRFGNLPFEFYDTFHGVWIECDTSYVHTGLETDTYLLFRHVGTLCEDFDRHLITAGQKPINQRVYMRHTHQALKGKGKARPAPVQSDSSEGEVEILDSPNRITIKTEPDARSPSLNLFKRPRQLSPPHHPTFSHGSSPSNAIEIQDSPTPCSTLRLYSFSPPPLPSQVPPSSFSPSPSPAISDITMPLLIDPYPQITGRTWPRSMYVVDMIPWFALMDRMKKDGKGNFEARFMDVFGQPPPPMNTYHDQVCRWAKAEPSARSWALSGGRTTSGEWSTFVKFNPLKKK